MLPPELQNHLEGVLEGAIEQIRPVSGGDIHRACQLTTREGTFFVKWNERPRSKDMFRTEALGLQELRSSEAVRIPATIAQGEEGPYAYLLLEYIAPGGTNPSALARLGRDLAELHRRSGDSFGLDHDNFIGPLPQPNGRHASFPDFYFRERLWPQFQIAHEKGLLSPAEGKKLEALGRQLPERIPDEPPALVHGDLWSGNYLVDEQGKPWLIDPAVAYSHREVDLGMSLLFGGFSPEFYEAYQETYPLKPGWRERVPLFQLYFLLVHLNVFGRSYYSAVIEAMK